MRYVLEALDITKKYGEANDSPLILKGVSGTFHQGVSYAITGVSGSGKSTLLHILSALDEPTSGTVMLSGLHTFSLPAQSRSRLLNQYFGFVFQFHYLLKELNVLENIMIPGLVKGESEPVCRHRAQGLLLYLGMSDKALRYPGELSGGEQQRVSIARALFNRPTFLFADEPTGNLDEANAANIVELFLKCKNEWGMGVIICSHDSAVYDKLDHTLRLHNGVLEQIR